MTTAIDMHKDAVIAELKVLLPKFVTMMDHSQNLSPIEAKDMERTRRRIEDLTSILEGYDKPRCMACGALATHNFCQVHAR